MAVTSMTVVLTPFMEQVMDLSACMEDKRIRWMVQIYLLAAVELNRVERICLFASFGLMTYPTIKCNIECNAISETVENSSHCNLIRQIVAILNRTEPICSIAIYNVTTYLNANWSLLECNVRTIAQNLNLKVSTDRP